MSRVALVTGGSRGIGRAIAMELAGRGAAVAVNYARNSDAADEVVQAIQSGGGRAMAIGTDVGDAEAVTAMFSAVEEELGRVEVLVNNAGITRDDLMLRMSLEAWDDVIATNLRSVFLCSKAALRGMLRSKWGRIISLSSVSGIAGNPGQANYAASKAGIIGFTKAVAKEVSKRKILVNCVAPGFIETDMTAELPPELRDGILSRVPLGRMGTPEDVADVVAFLATRGSYVNGSVVHVNGGIYGG